MILLQVNTIGVLSFRDTFFAMEPLPFPLSTSDTLIAPFWIVGDFGPQIGGISAKVFYRFSDNLTLFNQVVEYINDENGFTPASLFISTWRLSQFTGFDCLVSPYDCNQLLMVMENVIVYELQ